MNTHTSAKIVADSVSPAGHRLTTFEMVFPRIVLAEVNTHRMLSRNSASSRAIPIADMLKRVLEDPYVPIHWGKNQKGMSADEDVSPGAQDDAREEWVNARDYAVKRVRDLSNIGIHKQIANRPLEAFMWHTAVVTATEWSNFFNLRDTKDAHPDFRDLAHEAREQYQKNEPRLISYGGWHLPYITTAEIAENPDLYTGRVDARAISIGRCARVSYDRLHAEETPEKSKTRCDAMLAAGHMSPFEHVARPMTEQELEIFKQKKMRWSEHEQRWIWVGAEYGRKGAIVQPHLEEGYAGEHTHFLGNLNGWVQYRKLIPHEEDILGAPGMSDDFGSRLQPTPEAVKAIEGVVKDWPTTPAADMVNNPSHYGGADNVYEAIKVIEAWQLDFNLGNAVKYIARHRHKGRPLEDLRKARWYLERAIQNLEKSEPKRSTQLVHYRDRLNIPVACGAEALSLFESPNVLDVTCTVCLAILNRAGRP